MPGGAAHRDEADLPAVEYGTEPAAAVASVPAPAVPADRTATSSGPVEGATIPEESAAPDSAEPDVAVPASVAPGTAVAEGVAPDVAVPAGVVPDVAVPESVATDVVPPQTLAGGGAESLTRPPAGTGIDPAQRTPRSFHLPLHLLERARAAAHWISQRPGVDGPSNVSELVERALRIEVERLEQRYNGGTPFPAVVGRMRTGPGASGVERIRRAQRARRRAT